MTLPIAMSADPTAIFTGWTGACSGIGTCQVMMDGDQSVTANFSRRAVTLTAVADPGSTFTGWSGNCLVNGGCSVSWSSACATDEPCNITMIEDQAVTANFIKSSDPVIPPPDGIGGDVDGGDGGGGGVGGSGEGTGGGSGGTGFTPGPIKEVRPE